MGRLFSFAGIPIKTTHPRRRGTRFMPEFPFLFEIKALLSAAAPPHAVASFRSQGIAPRDERARSSIIAEPIFLYSDFRHGRAPRRQYLCD